MRNVILSAAAFSFVIFGVSSSAFAGTPIQGEHKLDIHFHIQKSEFEAVETHTQNREQRSLQLDQKDIINVQEIVPAPDGQIGGFKKVETIIKTHGVNTSDAFSESFGTKQNQSFLEGTGRVSDRNSFFGSTGVPFGSPFNNNNSGASSGNSFTRQFGSFGF
jgi:hypothetical protein